MKKILSALLLASMLVATLASCATDDSATTTTTGTTTVSTTTKAGPPPTEPPATDPNEVVTPPKVEGAGLEELLAGKTLLTDKVDTTKFGAVDFDSWNKETENISGLFDGVKTENQWYYDENGELRDPTWNPTTENDGPSGGGPGKCGGNLAWGSHAGGWFYFALTEKAKVSAYVITTGNDNSKYSDRNPVEWTLYATNDAAAYEAAIAGGITAAVDGGADYAVDETVWTVLDYVWDGQIAVANFAPNGYEIDAAVQGEYQYYCWFLNYTQGGSFQACELELYTG